MAERALVICIGHKSLLNFRLLQGTWGFPEDRSLYKDLQRGDWVVFGVSATGSPRSILEAIAFELPVVSTNVFGISDLIAEGRTGWLAPARDLERLLGVLHLVLRLPRDARAAVGSRARAEVLRRQGRDSDGLAIARAASSLIEDPGADVAGPSS
jgi:glycosyltransferase involved in cell wall biosynthesis